MGKFILLLAIVLIAFPLQAAERVTWERDNDVFVVWAKPKGLAKIRFGGGGDYSPESGCSKRAPEIVTVLSQLLYTPNGADDLFRARMANGHVNSYRIPLSDASHVVLSWLEDMIEEGKRVRVFRGQCGNGGFIYVDQIERVK